MMLPYLYVVRPINSESLFSLAKEAA